MTVDEIKVLITAETDGLKKGLGEATKELDKLKDSTVKVGDKNKSVWENMQTTMQGPVAAFKEIGAVVLDLLNEFGEAELAVTRLTRAAENNATKTSGMANRLAEYGEVLEKNSMFKAEEIQQAEAELAVLGLSEDQIKRMIKVGADWASATGGSLTDSVKKLNQTLQGSAGRIGQQNAAIGALTEEELKNGKAIDILEGQYAGFAETIGTTVSGKMDQLSKKFDDFKETAGGVLANVALAFDAFFSGDKAASLMVTLDDIQKNILGSYDYLQKDILAGGLYKGAARLLAMTKDAKLSGEDYVELLKRADEKTDDFSKAMVIAFRGPAEEYEKMVKAEQVARASAAKAIADKEEEARVADLMAKRDENGRKIREGIAKAYEAIAIAEKDALSVGREYNAEAEKRKVLDAAEAEAIAKKVIIFGEAGGAVGATVTALKTYRDALGPATDDTAELSEEVLGLSYSYSELMQVFGKTAGDTESWSTIVGDGYVNTGKKAQEAAEDVDQLKGAMNETKEESYSLADAFDDLGQSAKNALIGGVDDLFHAMDVAGSNMGDVWGAAADSFEAFMVDFIDRLPMLLLQAGLQLIGVGQWIPGLAMVAAAGGIALIDAFTTSDAEQQAYGTGAYAKPVSVAPSGGGDGKTTSTGSGPDESIGSESGLAGGVTVNIYGLKDVSPAVARREMEAAGRQMAFAIA